MGNIPVMGNPDTARRFKDADHLPKSWSLEQGLRI